MLKEFCGTVAGILRPRKNPMPFDHDLADIENSRRDKSAQIDRAFSDLTTAVNDTSDLFTGLVDRVNRRRQGKHHA